MMSWNLSPNVKTIRLKVDGTNYNGAAGTSALTSERVDMLGFLGVRFIIGLGAVVTNAVTSIKVRQDTDSAMGTAADIAGSSQTIADTSDFKLVITEIYRPYERYVDVVTTRATQNATVDFILAELYQPLDAPVTQDATVASYEFMNGSAEGTA